MNYIIESLFVGVYCVIIYLFLKDISLPFDILLFVSGFIKHLFGYILGFQQYYCNCIYFNNSLLLLLFECIIEAFLFLFIGHYLSYIIKNKIYLFFIIGMFLHIFVELIGGHSFFCKYKCSVKH
jgi:hypothetical protein